MFLSLDFTVPTRKSNLLHRGWSWNQSRKHQGGHCRLQNPRNSQVWWGLADTNANCGILVWKLTYLGIPRHRGGWKWDPPRFGENIRSWRRYHPSWTFFVIISKAFNWSVGCHTHRLRAPAVHILTHFAKLSLLGVLLDGSSNFVGRDFELFPVVQSVEENVQLPQGQ